MDRKHALMNRAAISADCAARQFSVHALHIESHYARVLHETSFEAAAVAYMEEFHSLVLEDDQIGVIVRDLSTNHQQCFTVNLHTGELAPCG